VTGWLVRVTHPAGPDGEVTTDQLAPDVPFLPEPLTAGQVDRVAGGEVSSRG
jgi:alpha-L-rhamnosidase